MLRILLIQSLLFIISIHTASQVSPSSDQLWCHNDHGVDGEGADGVAFQKALTHIQSTNLSRDGLQRLLNDTLLRFPCQPYKFESPNNTFYNWLTAENVYRTLHLTRDSYLSEEEFRNVTVIVISYLFSFTSNASRASNIIWNDLDMEDFHGILLQAPEVEEYEVSSECQDGNETLCLSEGQLKSVLRSIATEYIPGKLGSYSSCADGERAKEKDIRDTMCTFGDLKTFSSRNVRRNTVLNETTDVVIAKGLLGKMASIIFVNLLSGDCIVESEEGAPSNEDYLQSLFVTFGDNDTCGISHQGLERIVELLKIGKDTSNEVGTDDPGHTHRRRRRSTEEQDQDHDHEDTEVDVATKCLSMADLLRGFQLDVTHHPTLSKTDLYRLCPALLQQATIGCQPKTPTQPDVSSRPSAAEVYGFGTLAVGFVSACVVIALVVVRWKGTKIYRYLISTMLGLAVGSLAGDALLHLIPQALGVHEEGSDHDHTAAGDGGVVVEPYVWKALCGCGSLWFYYNLQLLLYKAGDIASYIRRVLGSRRSSSKNESDVGPVDLNGTNSDVTLNTYVNHSYDEDVTSTSLTDQRHDHQRGDENKDGGKEKKHKHEEKEVDDEDGVVHAHSSVAWMITIGDGIHNFADGLAMGAAFATNWRTGIGTTIAIFTHELPHEFGDTAVLLSAGWSTKKVLLFQLLSQATAFIGLYIGISVSENTDGAQLWIAAVAYGMFLYIALADVIPELIHFFSIYSPWLIFITSNLGICIGFLAMLLLAIYEEKISIAV